VPKLTRVAVLWNAANPYKEADLKEVQPVADAFKVAIEKVPVRGANDIEGAFNAAMISRPGGLLTLEDPFTTAHCKQIVDLAIKNRLPAVYGAKAFVDAGGVMFYGPDPVDQNRRAGAYVNKILKGTKPADLPVERPVKFEFIINLKTAKQIGLTIPPNVLARADRVIR
jgi:putative ABC transport system substrate-binding protein